MCYIKNIDAIGFEIENSISSCVFRMEYIVFYIFFWTMFYLFHARTEVDQVAPLSAVAGSFV